MRDNYVIYLDVVLVINLLMDYLVLWATARFGQFRTSGLRLFLGAVLGTCYALAILVQLSSSLVTLSVKLLFSVAMLLVAFGFGNWRYFMRVVGYFYAVSFAMGGAVLGAIYLVNENPAVTGAFNGVLLSLQNVHYSWLLVALVTALVVSRFASFIKKNLLHNLYSLPVIIRIGENQLAVKALLDTGNQLRDPLTQKPVLIVEYGVLRELLPLEVREYFDLPREPDVQQVLASISDEQWLRRLQLIPFTTIGRNHGMLLGIRPDEIIVVNQDKTVKVRDVILGLYQQKLSREGSYRALLHPDIAQFI